MNIEDMEKRAEKLHEHVQNHPSDYQSVVAELVLRSKIIDKARKEMVNARLKEVARIRREINEKQRQRDRDGRGYVEVDSTARSN